MKQKLLNLEVKHDWLKYPNLYVYQIDDGETHWVAAETEAEAIHIFVESYFYGDYTVPEYVKEYDPVITQMDHTKNLTIRDEERPTYDEETTRTCSEWCDSHGKGFLASTTY